jgi:hypothetical protein
MKTTVEIPDTELEDLMRFTGASSERQAILTAIVEYNRRRRVAALIEYAGKAEALNTPQGLQTLRRQRGSADC